MTGRAPGPADRAALLVEMWQVYRRTRTLLRTRELPAVVRELAVLPPVRGGADVDPVWLGRTTWRRLRWPGGGPVCLDRALVQFAMLSRRGLRPEVVIGLPRSASDKDAHAWVEVDHVDVGPPPGGSGHVPLARYGGGPTAG
jgi:hypothetical protein